MKKEEKSLFTGTKSEVTYQFADEQGKIAQAKRPGKSRNNRNEDEVVLKSKGTIALTIILIALIVLMIPIIITNITIAFQLRNNEKQVPVLFGVTPIIVQTVDAAPDVNSGDIALIREFDAKNLRVNDVVGFISGGYICVNYIEKIKTINDKIYIKPKIVDAEPGSEFWVDEDDLIGICVDSLSGAGDFVLFVSSPWGIAVFVNCVTFSVFFFSLYYKRKMDGKVVSIHKNQNDTDKKDGKSKLKKVSQSKKTHIENKEKNIFKNEDL